MKIRKCTNKDVQLLNRNVNNIKEYLVVEKDKEVVGIFKYYFYDKSYQGKKVMFINEIYVVDDNQEVYDFIIKHSANIARDKNKKKLVVMNDYMIKDEIVIEKKNDYSNLIGLIILFITIIVLYYFAK